MKIYKLAIVLLALAAAHMLPAKQEQKSNVYRAGDTACMVGDSITAGGWYTANIMLYYASRFPESYVDFRNIGISGDGCHGILWRMDWDILPQLDKNKAVSVLMIGMNDVGRAKFGKAAREKSGEAGLQKKILVTRKNYENRLAQVIDSLSANSRKLIVFTPSIYDQTAEIDSENLFGVNDELVVFGRIGKKLASAKDNAATVDMSKAMLETNAKVQAAEGKDKTIIGKDRVHPSFAGGLVMLEKWLADLSEPTEVSNIEISANKKTPARAFNCDISNLAVSKEKISFDALEAALPFAVPADARWILKYTDFQDKFNRQILKITDLPKGSYALKIDGENVGKYSSEDLAKGVNLAGNDKTPQYRQAEKLLKKCLQFKNDAAAYRSIFMVELFERRQMPATLSDEEKIAHIEKLYKEKA
ncbi:MAG: hypothetical protein IJI37_05225, partial [Opitutales bacterium]|nr:hypothetical protein [Opitutales bacterium]